MHALNAMLIKKEATLTVQLIKACRTGKINTVMCLQFQVYNTTMKVQAAYPKQHNLGCYKSHSAEEKIFVSLTMVYVM